MSHGLSPETREWLKKKGWETASVEPVLGGSNNRVYRIRNEATSQLLKISVSQPDDPRNRFLVEKEFYDLLKEKPLPGVPRRYAFDETLKAALYEWIEGTTVRSPVGQKELKSALEFLVGIQGTDCGTIDRRASEACFSISEHRNIIQGRIEKILEHPRSQKAILQIVKEEVVPRWQQLEEGLTKLGRADFKAHHGRKIFSPGDFGFHNAIRRLQGDIVFFDFEYSGFDDPAKTVADIFLQPEQPVDFAYWHGFCHELAERVELELAFALRANALLPLFAVKWSCILASGLIKRNVEPSSDEESLQIDKIRSVLARGKTFSREIL